jgi:cytoskeletal protein CcmA (bactofilin family)
MANQSIEQKIAKLHSEITKKVSGSNVKQGAIHYGTPSRNSKFKYEKDNPEVIVNGDLKSDYEFSEVHNLTVLGDAKIHNKDIARLNVSGSAKISLDDDLSNNFYRISEIAVGKDLELHNCRSVGDVLVGGNAKINCFFVGSVHASGVAVVEGNIKGSVRTGGDAIIEGDVGGKISSGKDIKVSGDVKGEIRAKGNVVVDGTTYSNECASTCHDIIADGHVSVGGNTFGSIKSKGFVRIGGNAERAINGREGIYIGGKLEASAFTRGDLEVSAIGGYEPSHGGDDRFPLVSARSVTVHGDLDGTVTAKTFVKAPGIAKDAKITAPLVFLSDRESIDRGNIKGEVIFIAADKFSAFDPSKDKRVKKLIEELELAEKPSGKGTTGGLQIQSPVPKKKGLG